MTPTTEQQAHEFVAVHDDDSLDVCGVAVSDVVICNQPRDAAIHRLASDTRPCKSESCPFGLPTPHSINDHPILPSEPQAVPPPLTTDECLRDLQAWIEFALKGEIKGRQTGSGPSFNAYSYVEIPEWSMRQKLDNITIALTRASTTTALAEALRDAQMALRAIPQDALGRDAQEGYYRDEVLTKVTAALARWEGKGNSE